MMQITRLRDERAARIREMRGLVEAADAEGRDLTAEETGEWEARDADVQRLDREIERRERLEVLQPSPALVAEATREAIAVADSEVRSDTPTIERPEYRTALMAYLRGDELTASERRDLSVGTNSAGGFTVPVSMANEIVRVAREFGVMRQLARVIATAGGETLNIPRITAFGSSGWTAENTAFTESDPTFATASLSAYKATHIAQVSEELLQDSMFDIAALLAEIMGQNLGVLTNTAYVVGDGSAKPTGITTQTTAGKTGATGQTTSIIGDDLVDLLHSVLRPYRASASWLMNDASVKVIRKLKTGVSGDNTFLWQPGLQAGQPDTILGRPVYTDPDVPVMAANAKSVLFGDFRGYWIRDAGGISVQRLNELYAATGQVGFRVFLRTDGKLIDTSAVKHYANSAT